MGRGRFGRAIGLMMLLWGVAWGQEQPPPPPGPPPPPAEQGQAQPGQPPPPPAGQEQPAQPPQPAQPAPLPELRRPGGLISMAFENADIGAVLRALSDIWNTTIVADPSLAGTITVISTVDVTPEESFEILRSVLDVKGFTLLGRLGDKVIKVVPKVSAPTQGAARVYGPRPPEEIGDGDKIITQIFALKYVQATRLQQELRSLVPQGQGVITAISATNHLIVTDTTANVRRLAEIIQILDRPDVEVLELEVITLKNADAQQIAQLITQIFQTTDTRQLAQQLFRGGPPPGGPEGQQAVQMLLQQGAFDLRSTVRVQPDLRTNSLVVYASRKNIDAIKELVEKLDVDLRPRIIFKTYRLQNADAQAVAQAVSQLLLPPPTGVRAGVGGGGFFPFGGGFGFRTLPTDLLQQRRGSGMTNLQENMVVPDIRTNSVTVTSTEENIPIIDQLIAALDSEASLKNLTRVFRLENAVASELAQTLNQIFRGQVGFGGFFGFIFGVQQAQGPLGQLRNLTAIAEPKTNSVIVTGPAHTFDLVEELVRSLDQRVPQVYIHVVIADITLTDEEKLGVQWSWLNSTSRGDVISTQFGLETETTGLRYSILNTDFTSLLHMLATRSDVQVISTPHIMTLDNTEGQIIIGTRYPFIRSIVTTATAVVPQFQFEDISLSLTVTPHINRQSGLITLEVNQTINELTGTVQQSGYTLPIIANREATTSVLVRSGQTIIIGGIRRERDDVTVNKVPILGDIPLVGELFRSRRKQKTQSELVVFLTPFIVETDEQAAQLRQQQEERMRELLKGREVRPPALPPSSSPDASEEPQAQGSAPSPNASVPADPETHSAKEPSPVPPLLRLRSSR